MGTGKTIITAAIILTIVAGAVVTLANFIERQKPPNHGSQADRPGDGQSSQEFSLSNLALPFALTDINEQRGEVNPLGIVRFSKDEGASGHSGIDIPLNQGAPIYAVADGTIVNIPSANDPWGGQGIYHLIQPTLDGEGWAFIYEHVTPATGITVGKEIKQGDLIATKTPPADFTAHFQLSYLFNNYQFTRDNLCWPDSLGNPDQQQLLTWWETYRQSAHLLSSWRTTQEEGAFPFRALLDTTNYPTGPQLCYPAGTDVR